MAAHRVEIQDLPMNSWSLGGDPSRVIPLAVWAKMT
jgi:hypothetical protein